MNKKKKRQVLIIIGIVILVFFLFGNSGFRNLMRRYLEIHKLNTKLRSLRQENQLLKKEIYDLEHNPSYIEKMARRELGLVSKDEVEYRFNAK